MSRGFSDVTQEYLQEIREDKRSKNEAKKEPHEILEWRMIAVDHPSAKQKAAFGINAERGKEQRVG